MKRFAISRCSQLPKICIEVFLYGVYCFQCCDFSDEQERDDFCSQNLVN